MQEVDGKIVHPGTTRNNHTIKLEAYASRKLAHRICDGDVISTTFKRISSNGMVWKRCIKGLTMEDPNERWTIAQVVNTSKGHLYNFDTPTHCFRYNI